jgi:ferredoxin--NADP+ reductase
MTASLERPPEITLAAIPPVHSNIYTPKDPFRSTVLQKRPITQASSPNRAWHVVLSLEGSKMAGKYRAGQSIGVLPAGRFAEPRLNYAHRSLDHKLRLYSIASASWGDDWKGETVSLAVKREIEEDSVTGELVFGEVSNLVCDAKPGDVLDITGPVGKSFLLPDDPLDHNYVFVATGTGIAPFRGMLIELCAQGFQREVWLIFGVPYSTDVLYHDEFLQLAEQHPNVRYITAVSREQKNPHGGKMYTNDRLQQYQDLLVPLLEKPETIMYMCGLKGMEFGIYKWLHLIRSNLVTRPADLSVEEIQALPVDSPAWGKIERERDKTRLLKETY